MDARIVELDSVREMMPLGDSDFASSLSNQYHQKGSLSGKQWYWVEELIRRAVSPAPAPTEEKLDGECVKIFEMFQKAKEKLKYPKINLTRGDVAIKFTMAGPTAKFPGTINIIDQHNENWYGRIHADGVWGMSRNAVSADGVKALVRDFAKNPQELADELGKLAGHCCFCNSELTHETSTGLGYGPTCAKNWGLEWSKSALAAKAN